jgi:GNAT superfamily N-acetyltransferase
MLFEEMARVHPRERHWYLPLMGVDLTRQGQGIGTALLQHAMERVDRTGLPSYLESSNGANLSFYRRFGFEPIGSLRVGDSPELVPMYRPGRKRTAWSSPPRP